MKAKRTLVMALLAGFAILAAVSFRVHLAAALLEEAQAEAKALKAKYHIPRDREYFEEIGERNKVHKEQWKNRRESLKKHLDQVAAGTDGGFLPDGRCSFCRSDPKYSCWYCGRGPR